MIGGQMNKEMNNLDKAIDGLKKGRIPDGPPPEAVKALKRKIAESGGSDAALKSEKISIKERVKAMGIFTKIAAVIVFFLAGIFGWWNIGADKPVMQDTGIGEQGTKVTAKTGDEKQTEEEKAQQQKVTEDLAKIKEMKEQENVRGLMAVLDSDEYTFEGKLAAAQILAQTQREDAIEAVQKFIEENQPEDSGTEAEIQGEIPKENPNKSQPGEVPEVKDMNAADKSAVEGFKSQEVKEGVIKFMAINKATGRPMEDVQFKFHMRKPKVKLQAVSDKKGLCEFHFGKTDPNREGHRLAVRAYKPGFVPMRTVWHNQKGRPFNLPKTYIVNMEKGTTIGGKVVDPNGNPIENVLVEVSTNKKYDPVQRANIRKRKVRTDKDGRWTFGLMPENYEYAGLEFSHENFASAEEYIGENDEEELKQLKEQKYTKTLSYGTVIDGFVTDEAGNPLKDAKVALGEKYCDKKFHFKTDEKGYFNCGLIDMKSNINLVGKNTLLLEKDGFALKAFKFNKQMVKSPLNIAMQKGREYTIQVVDKNGEPLKNSYVNIWEINRININKGLKTDDQGFFSVRLDDENQIRMNISRQNFMSKRLNLPEEFRDAVVLYPALEVEGIVTDAETRERIKTFKVVRGSRYSERSNTSWQNDEHSIKTFSGGKFDLQLTNQSYEYYFRFIAEDYQLAEKGPFYYDPNDPFLNIDVKLSKGDPVYCRVFDPNGNAVNDAEVYFLKENYATIQNNKVRDQYYLSKQETSDGRVKIPSYADEKGYVFVNSDAGYLFTRAEELVQDGNDIFLKPWAKVEGYADILPGGDGRKLSLSRSLRYQANNDEESHRNMNTLHFNYSEEVQDNGYFCFEKVAAVDSENSGWSLSQMVRKNERSYTHINHCNFEIYPGETTYQEIINDGLEIRGKIILPADILQKVDLERSNLRAIRTDAGTESTGMTDRMIMYKISMQIQDEAARMLKKYIPTNWQSYSLKDKLQWYQDIYKTEQGAELQQKMQKMYQEVKKQYPELGRQENHLKASTGHFMNSDGNFRIFNAREGNYQIRLELYEMPEGNQWRGERIGTYYADFSISPEEYNSQERLLDIGNLKAISQLDYELDNPVRLKDVLKACSDENGNTISEISFAGKITLFKVVHPFMEIPEKEIGVIELLNDMEGVKVIFAVQDSGFGLITFKDYIKEYEYPWQMVSVDLGEFMDRPDLFEITFNNMAYQVYDASGKLIFEKLQYTQLEDAVDKLIMD